MKEVGDKEHQDLFERISGILNMARQLVVQTVNHTMVYGYFEIGRAIVEGRQHGGERASYGKSVLKRVSAELTARFGRGFSVDNLERMRKFYLTYPDRISATPLRKLGKKGNLPMDFPLSWSHYLKLMQIDDNDERRFYELESTTNNWSLKELKRQSDSALYHRLALSRDKKGVAELSKKGQVVVKPEDSIKDPYILEFLGLPEHSRYSESDMEQGLIDKLEHFLLELGKGFTFVSRQERISFDERHFRIDLVFYNRILRSFVLIDLKIGDVKHQDLGQMQMYVNYYDRKVRLPEENKTVGIVLGRSKSTTLVEFTLPEDNKQIFASKYQMVLPSKKALKKLIEAKDE
ncbi:YhcG family protein [Pricia sp.]|uniref:PDDEXK nuclease domain-containing protein n=1 Tax=Pricia sp. TaxID=2268138 RepID=UPI0035935EE7